MADFASIMGNPGGELSLEEQKKLGAPPGGTMDAKYTEFLKLVTKLLKEGQIDPLRPESFLKEEAFGKLREQDQDKVSAALVTIADFLSHIEEFYLSKETPDSSPQLAAMIESLWQMTKRIEGQYGDVFKF